MKVDLGENHKDFNTLLLDLAHDRFDKFDNVVVKPSFEHFTYQGATISMKDGSYKVIFGMKPEDGISLSGKECLEGIKTIHHELRHIGQYMTNFKICSDYASICRIDDVASEGSSRFYGAYKDQVYGHHYYHNIREMDAEYDALHGVLEVLSDESLFPDIKDPEMVLINYLNDELCRFPSFQKYNPRRYYLDFTQPLTSMEQVDEMFEQQMAEAVYMKAEEYNPKFDRTSDVGILMHCRIPPWNRLEKAIMDAPDGEIQRRIVAGVEAAVRPELTECLTEEEKDSIRLGLVLGIKQEPKVPWLVMSKIRNRDASVSRTDRPLPDVAGIRSADMTEESEMEML